MEEVLQYARLFELGCPDFVEIKGVTYCGNSPSSGLTLGNVPYHADVCAFSEEMCNQSNGEHEVYPLQRPLDTLTFQDICGGCGAGAL